MLDHGGRLREAAARYNIPLADWLDLSTGINPTPWPVPALPAEVWQRLPEAGDGLEEAAAAYYGNARLLPLPGSQAAIQRLPQLLPRAAVACLAPLYNEHPQAWQGAGHKVRQLAGANLNRALTAATPYVLLCNPNNPGAEHYSRELTVDAAQQLKKRGGWLIVDEAFMDTTPGDSLAALAGSSDAPNLIVLRSLGKFFGLAGARVGFIFAAPDLLERLAEALGPWPLAGPARAVARLALADRAWQDEQRQALPQAASRLHALLEKVGETRSTALFATVKLAEAAALHDFLAQRAILTRHYPELPLLRLGLPGSAADWQRLENALAAWSAR